MNRLLALLLLFTAATGLSGQQTVLHLDRPYHAAGEVSRFQVYLPQPAPRLIRTEIYGPEGAMIDYFFLRSAAGSAVDGYYRWGYNLPTGYYRMRFSGLLESGETVDLGTFRHPVYDLADRRADATADPEPTTGWQGKPLDLRVENTTISAAGLPPGAYSISVRNREVTGGETASYAVDISAPAGTYADTLFYGGVLTDPGTSEPVAVNLLPVFDTRTLNVYFSKSDADGRFTLTVPSFEGSKTVQARGVRDAAIRATLQAATLESITAAPPLTEQVKAYLDLSQRRQKIYQLYGSVETPLDAVAEKESVRDLQPNESFNVQDYQTFPDMQTFFNEVAGELRYRRRRGEWTVNLYNAPNQRFFTGTPLFIVDGRLTRDVDYIAALPPANVSRLDYFYDNRELRRDFPALGGDGVVRIDLLRESDKFPAEDAANLITLEGIQPEDPFEQPERDAPRLSPLLFWEAGRTEGGSLQFPLPPTDDPGVYEVTLVVRNRNTGETHSGTATVTLEASR